MAGYKVSYKVLRQQGEALKATAKLLDGYSERVKTINGKLGSDNMLAEIRNNLQKLSVQLGESRAILNTAGEFLGKSTDNYSKTETTQVKKVDGLKAHNRDFYKNPVVVASAGGAATVASAGGAAATMASGASGAATPSNTSTTTSTESTVSTVNYTDNSVTNNYSSVPESSAPVDTTPSIEPVAAASTPSPAVNAPPATVAVPEVAAQSGGGPNAAVIGGAAAGLGAAAGVGAVIGAKKLKDRQPPAEPDYDPEAELAKARERLLKLDAEDAEADTPGE
ncbi:MAG: hypothetical protein LBN43_01450 [Oscillospiraceae bacterium]|jgi:hypothetical protein|nr:hypothetical protein [Oscillospiraceae bacterium]